MEPEHLLRKIFAATLLAVWPLATGACLDPPVALDPADPEPAEEAGSLAPDPDRAANAADSITIHEQDGHRISFTFDTEAPPTPNTPVTLRITGEAHEPIDGGTVVLTLPTKAAMDHAGPGRGPYYPQGVAHPEEARWELPKMAAGETWTRTFTVPAAGAGYYLVALGADTHGPKSPLGPFMADDVYYQTWVAVSDEGGGLTDFFDPSVFPEGVVPVPGPFTSEAELFASAGDSLSPLARKAKPRAKVYLNVTYLHGRRLGHQPAVDAKIWSKLYKGTEAKTDKRELTVPASGIVSFTCPDSGYYLKGKAYLPDTPYVDGTGDFVYDWRAYHDHCGDTLNVGGERRKYMPWRHLHLAAIRINSHFGYSRGRVHWKVDMNREGSYYRTFIWWNKIVFGSRGYDRAWVAAHEYTHALHDKSLGGLWSTDNCNPHYVDSISSYTCAFSEGLADYGGAVGSNGERWDWETYDDGEPGTKGKIEGYVAALFHDLIDWENEDGDETSLYSRYVIKVFKTCRVKPSRSWMKRNDVSDFVWCLENRVNSTVHRENFPGINPPGQVSEQATEPSDWDADDIRSTWLLNLEGD